MIIIDKREKGKEWKIEIMNQACPFITYPANIVACTILDKRGEEETYCCEINCPIKKQL